MNFRLSNRHCCIAFDSSTTHCKVVPNGASLAGRKEFS